MNVELHLIVNGVDRGPLPSYESLSLSPVFCDIGAISFKYPKKGKRFALIKGRDELEIVPWIDGVPQPRLGGYVNQASADDVAETAIVDYTGQTYLRRMEEIRAYPKNWPNYDPKNPTQVLSSSNPGQIMSTLMTAAQARGTGTDLTFASFTASVDSAGQPWAKMITIEVKPGATLLGVLQSMYSNNMIDFEMVGKDLRIYNYGTLSVDRTVQAGKPLIFRRGRDLTDSPRKTSSRDVATVVLAAGKEDAGLYHEEVDATAIAGRRRIEGFVSNGNFVDAGTLEAFAEAQLSRSVNPTMEKTHGLALENKKTPKPLKDFNVGDWAYSDSGEGLERLRIKAWVISVDNAGAATGSVTLNDLIAEINANLSKRIDGIIGGSTITGESKAVDAVPVALTDKLAPATPGAVGLASAAYSDAQGNWFAQITATWSQVTTNADGSPLTDLGGYTVSWRYANGNATAWGTEDTPGTETGLSWSGLRTGEPVDVRVRAYDNSGNRSPWSTIYQVTTQKDTTPPERPSTPVGDNWAGLLRFAFDGKTASGAAWAPDVVYWQVHVSSANDFTPVQPSSTGPGTLYDVLRGAGNAFVDPGYDQTRFAKIVAVDANGNLSTPSAQASATTSRLVTDDLLAGAVDAGKIADGAITNTKLGLGAVTGVKLADFAVSTDKIANTAVTGGKIANLAIGTAHIALLAIDSTLIKDAAVGTAKIADLAVSAAKIDALAVGTAKIADLAVSGAKIADLAVVNAKIADLAVNDAKIGSLSVAKLVSGSVTAEILMAGRIRTAASGARVEFSSLGIYQYDSAGNATVSIPNSGDATFRGNIVGSVIATGTQGSRVEIGRASYVAGPISQPTNYIAEEVRFFPTVSNGERTVNPPRIYTTGSNSTTASDTFFLLLSSGKPTFGTAAAGVHAEVYIRSGTAGATGANATPFVNISAAGGNFNVDAARVTMGAYGTTATSFEISSRSIMHSADITLNPNYNGTAATTPMGTTTAAANLYYGGAATGTQKILRSTSSRRYKKDIADLGREAIEKVLALRPVHFRSANEHDDPETLHLGLIAEEVHEAGLTEIVNYNDFGDGPVPDGIQYDRLAVLMLPLLLEAVDAIRSGKVSA